MKPLDLLERMYEALRSPLGIVIATEDPERLRQKLYALRKERQERDPQLADLSFLPSRTNPQGELWILKRRSTSSEEN